MAIFAVEKSNPGKEGTRMKKKRKCGAWKGNQESWEMRKKERERAAGIPEKEPC